VDEVFGVALERLLALSRHHQPQTLRLPNGLGVWMTGTLTASDGADFKHAVAVSRAPPPAAEAAPLPASDTPAPAPETAHESTPQATLLDHKQRLIESTLAACGGNIAKAARALGVSRGMLYRRLQKAQVPDAG
nr:helix-turn-helix domain-containing protein [Burkholderiaceae bacterium]